MTHTLNDLADAFDRIAEGFATASLQLRAASAEYAAETPQDAPDAAVPTEPASGTTAPSFDDLPPEDWGEPDPTVDQITRTSGSASVCPAHNIPYRKGRYGPYCPSTSDDPDFSNSKGYCSITPRSASAWMRKRAAAR